MTGSRIVWIGSLALFAVMVAIGVTAVAQSGSTNQEGEATEEAVAAAEGGEAAEAGEAAFSLIRGSDVPVRRVGAADFDETAKMVAIEAFRDEDLGSVVYLTSDGSVGVMPAPANFTIRTVAYQGSFALVRFMPRMGTCWLMEEGEWRLIEETDTDLFMGDYQIRLVASGEDLDIVRVEQLTGATWFMSEYRWTAVAEPAPETADGE